MTCLSGAPIVGEGVFIAVSNRLIGASSVVADIAVSVGGGGGEYCVIHIFHLSAFSHHHHYPSTTSLLVLLAQSSLLLA